MYQPQSAGWEHSAAHQPGMHPADAHEPLGVRTSLSAMLTAEAPQNALGHTQQPQHPFHQGAPQHQPTYSAYQGEPPGQSYRQDWGASSANHSQWRNSTFLVGEPFNEHGRTRDHDHGQPVSRPEQVQPAQQQQQQQQQQPVDIQRLEYQLAHLIDEITYQEMVAGACKSVARHAVKYSQALERTVELMHPDPMSPRRGSAGDNGNGPVERRQRLESLGDELLSLRHGIENVIKQRRDGFNSRGAAKSHAVLEGSGEDRHKRIEGMVRSVSPPGGTNLSKLDVDLKQFFYELEIHFGVVAEGEKLKRSILSSSTHIDDTNAKHVHPVATTSTAKKQDRQSASTQSEAAAVAEVRDKAVTAESDHHDASVMTSPGPSATQPPTPVEPHRASCTAVPAIVPEPGAFELQQRVMELEEENMALRERLLQASNNLFAAREKHHHEGASADDASSQSFSLANHQLLLEMDRLAASHSREMLEMESLLNAERRTIAILERRLADLKSVGGASNSSDAAEGSMCATPYQRDALTATGDTSYSSAQHGDVSTPRSANGSAALLDIADDNVATGRHRLQQVMAAQVSKLRQQMSKVDSERIQREKEHAEEIEAMYADTVRVREEGEDRLKAARAEYDERVHALEEERVGMRATLQHLGRELEGLEGERDELRRVIAKIQGQGRVTAHGNSGLEDAPRFGAAPVPTMVRGPSGGVSSSPGLLLRPRDGGMPQIYQGGQESHYSSRMNTPPRTPPAPPSLDVLDRRSAVEESGTMGRRASNAPLLGTSPGDAGSDFRIISHTSAPASSASSTAGSRKTFML